MSGDEGTGGEVERLERKLDDLSVQLASFGAPDELLAVLLAEIETTKQQLRQALGTSWGRPE
jgi:hypothetical protein